MILVLVLVNQNNTRMHENSPQSIHFEKLFLVGGMPPDPPSMGHLRDSHLGFLHKLGNPLPQILDLALMAVLAVAAPTAC